MKFKASLDSFAVILTIAAILIFTAIGIMISRDISASADDPQEVLKLSLILLSLVLIILFCFLFRTTGYSIDPGQLTIHRPVKNLSFPLSEIESIAELTKGDLKGTIRSFGVGGLFGYFGKFYNMKLGRMTFYATRRDQAVLIRLRSGKQILLTPDDRERFIRELKNSR